MMPASLPLPNAMPAKGAGVGPPGLGAGTVLGPDDPATGPAAWAGISAVFPGSGKHGGGPPARVSMLGDISDIGCAISNSYMTSRGGDAAAAPGTHPLRAGGSRVIGGDGGPDAAGFPMPAAALPHAQRQ